MRFLFCGLGSIGQRHLKNLHTLLSQRGESFFIDSLRSSTRKPGAEICEKLTHTYTSIAELREAHPLYNAIFITNPTALHYETILSLQDFTECFFVEKPVFSDTDVDLTAIKNLHMHYVACPLRYKKAMQWAMKHIDTRQVIAARAICSTYLPDWRPGTDYRKTYSANAALGGGVSIDLIHEWDYLSAFLGFPLELKRMCGHFSALEINTEDIAVYIARYETLLLSLHLDYFGRQKQRNLQLFTDNTVYTIDLLNNSVSFDNGQSEIVFEEDHNVSYLEEMSVFLNVVSGKTNSPNTIEHAQKVMALCLGNSPSD